MPHRFFDGNEVRSRFIEVQAEGVTETVEVKAASCKTCGVKLMDKDVVDALLTDMRVFPMTGE
jgi:hypothetical protein